MYRGLQSPSHHFSISSSENYVNGRQSGKAGKNKIIDWSTFYLELFGELIVCCYLKMQCVANKYYLFATHFYHQYSFNLLS